MTNHLQVTTPDGTFSCHVAAPQAPGPFPVIVILQEIFGVNDGIRSIAADYAKKGYIAVCPDLFWRAEPGLSLSETSKESWIKGFSLYTTYDLIKGVQDISAVIATARTLANSTGKVGVTGYCMGGLLTFLCAAQTNADACVAYYGGGTERYLDEAQHIRAPLLYHLAGDDEYIGPDARASIKTALNDLPHTEVHTYSGQQHAFARPGGTHYNPVEAFLANRRTDIFFRRYLH